MVGPGPEMFILWGGGLNEIWWGQGRGGTNQEHLLRTEVRSLAQYEPAARAGLLHAESLEGCRRSSVRGRAGEKSLVQGWRSGVGLQKPEHRYVLFGSEIVFAISELVASVQNTGDCA